VTPARTSSPGSTPTEPRTVPRSNILVEALSRGRSCRTSY
jgi:hypothetical protein